MNCFYLLTVALFLQIGTTDGSEIVFESKYCDNVVLLDSVEDDSYRNILGNDRTMRLNDKEEMKDFVLKNFPEEMRGETECPNGNGTTVTEISPVAYCVKIFQKDHFLPCLLEECILLFRLESSSNDATTVWCLGRIVILHNDFSHSPGLTYFVEDRKGKPLVYTREKPSIDAIRNFISAMSFGNQDFTAVLSSMDLKSEKPLFPTPVEVLKIYLYPEFAELEEFLHYTPSAEVQREKYEDRVHPFIIIDP